MGHTKPDIVLLPTFTQVEWWRKRSVAIDGRGLFAQTVTTFEAWIADLWELHGDGRTIVGGAEREIALCRAFEEAQLDVPAGSVALAAACVRTAAGVAAFESAVDCVRYGGVNGQLSPRENDFLLGIAHYEDMLVESSLIELGHAASLLAQHEEELFTHPLRVAVEESGPLSWIAQQFFDTCTRIELDCSFAQASKEVQQAPDGVALQFAFPSGRMAQPGLIGDLASAFANGEGRAITVACKDPLSMFEKLEDRLANVGFQVCVEGSKPFGHTDFGRAYLALCQALFDQRFDWAHVSDALLTFYSGFSQADALAIDAALRADRIAARDDVLATLRAASESFSQLEEVARDPEADILLGVFEQAVQSSVRRGAAWRAEQLAAIAGLRKVTTAARRFGADTAMCVSVLTRMVLRVSCGTTAGESRVAFATQGIAARLAPGSCDALVVCDLTAQDYPVADKDDAVATMLAKLGMVTPERALDRARRTFNALLRLPHDALVLMRPLGDDDANETYPSAVLEEFVDAYRADPSATDDIDNAYRLPEALQAGKVERGEEALFANSRALDAAAGQSLSASIDEPKPENIAPEQIHRVAPRRFDAEGNALAKPCPSPSQIEVYLECPYRWFATRRLRAEGLDEGFGPLEKGTFAHAALETFYRRFQAAGHRKVTEGNLEDARVLMRGVLDELEAAQPTAEPGSGRLVAANELERREVAMLKQQLVSYLDVEAALLPTFYPAYFEYAIDADHAVDYAGYSLVGMVDRIDVDDAGHAVIVDYKGSVNAEHQLAGKIPEHVGKVQTRIYARAVERALGLQVVGALYVSYGRKPGVAGAYDPRVVEAAHLPFMNHEKCSCGTLEELPDDLPEGFTYADLTFDAMLDATEEVVGDAIARMTAGDVAQRPAQGDACSFCPIIACSKRGA